MLLYLSTRDYNDGEVPIFGIEKSQDARVSQQSVDARYDLNTEDSNQNRESSNNAAGITGSTMGESAMDIEQNDLIDARVKQLVSVMEVTPRSTSALISSDLIDSKNIRRTSSCTDLPF